MSSALVPGRILLDAAASRLCSPGSLLWSSNSDTPGDVGPIWSSAMGGGDGRRGDDEGDTAAMLFRADVADLLVIADYPITPVRNANELL